MDSVKTSGRHFSILNLNLNISEITYSSNSKNTGTNIRNFETFSVYEAIARDIVVIECSSELQNVGPSFLYHKLNVALKCLKIL